jgi:hypothetical protein
VRLRHAVPAQEGDVIAMATRSDLGGNPRYSLTLVHEANGSARQVLPDAASAWPRRW